MERDIYVNMYTYNRSLLLSSVDVLIGPYIVGFLVTKVFTVVHVPGSQFEVRRIPAIEINFDLVK